MDNLGECDIVLKGGMTSGVLYPAMLAKLSTRFRFRGLGGASAGAIAAALGAAAEYGRIQGRSQSFDALRRISDELMDPERLSSLFAPDAPTADLFAKLKALMEPRRKWPPLQAVNRLRMIMSFAMNDRMFEPWVHNGFGLCSGMSSGPGRIALTPWIQTRINELAGLGPDDVLTFGMLRGARDPISLKLIATGLEIARRIELPAFDHRWAFDSVLWSRLFPPNVIQHLLRTSTTRRVAFMPRELSPLPGSDDLPVIVAVRMSMAFPALFTPIPVHIPDPSRRSAYVRIHLADGGITSNLPSTLFDEPVPIRPVFIVNLRYSRRGHRRARSNVDACGVWMPRSAGDGNVDLVESLDFDSARSAAIALAKSVLTAARNWSDNRWLRMPAYRDRIIEIWLDEDEGGFNLHMSGEAAARLVAKGERAAEVLIERFGEVDSRPSSGFVRHLRNRRRTMVNSMSSFARKWVRASAQHEGIRLDAKCSVEKEVHEALMKIEAVHETRACGSRCGGCCVGGVGARLMLTGDDDSSC